MLLLQLSWPFSDTRSKVKLMAVSFVKSIKLSVIWQIVWQLAGPFCRKRATALFVTYCGRNGFAGVLHSTFWVGLKKLNEVATGIKFPPLSGSPGQPASQLARMQMKLAAKVLHLSLHATKALHIAHSADVGVGVAAGHTWAKSEWHFMYIFLARVPSCSRVLCSQICTFAHFS